MSGDTMRTIVCEPGDCPIDPAFEHDNYFGCIPRDFNQRSGRSKTRSQRAVDADVPGGKRYLWNGGCDGAATP